MKAMKMIFLLILGLIASTTENCMICQKGMYWDENVVECSKEHLFHDWCLYKWSKENSTCPVCREEFSDELRNHMDKLRELERKDEQWIPEYDNELVDKYKRRDKNTSVLVQVGTGIEKKAWKWMNNHNCKAIFFDESSDYYLPEDVMEYLRNSPDPCTKEFRRCRNIVFRRAIRYLADENAPSREIVWELLGAIWVGDCLMEYECTDLSTEDSDKKLLELEENCDSYPALFNFVYMFMTVNKVEVSDVKMGDIYELLLRMISEDNQENMIAMVHVGGSTNLSNQWEVFLKEYMDKCVKVTSRADRAAGSEYDLWESGPWRYDPYKDEEPGESFISTVLDWIKSLIDWVVELFGRITEWVSS